MSEPVVFKDFLGQPLSPGDNVVVCYGANSSVYMREDVITKFNKSRIYLQKGNYKQRSDQILKIPKELLVERLIGADE